MEMVACHHKSRCFCHLERNEVESRDLRIIVTFQVKSVRRSLDSLRSLGMTAPARHFGKPPFPTPTEKNQMETRKLYYEDCHMAEFTAAVLSCEQVENGWEVILDATAFYPEGGGQACDLGELGGVNVLDVQERGEAIVHTCNGPLNVGETVEGKLNWARRFDLMQQHSGEHIVSGIIHTRYGHHNVGFHVSSDVITIDFDGPIPAADLPIIENMANAAVWQNLPMHIWYPAEEELPTVGYRTKKALPWPVRIVEVPGYDKCPTFNKTWTEPVNANAFAQELIKHTYRDGWKLPDMPKF